MDARDDYLISTALGLGPAMTASISPFPPPQEMSVDWLMLQSHGANIEIATCGQIALIDRRTRLILASSALRWPWRAKPLAKTRHLSLGRTLGFRNRPAPHTPRPELQHRPSKINRSESKQPDQGTST